MFIERSTETEKAEQRDSIIPNSTRPHFIDSLRLVDHLTILFVSLLAFLLLFFHTGIRNWPIYVLTNVAFICFLLGLIWLAGKSSSRVVRFFRDTYPFFFYTFVFKEVALIINILFPFWLEPHLIKLDFLVFGDNPTVWVQQYFRPWLSEFMAFAYWSYYVLLPIIGVTFYVRKDKIPFHSFVFSLSFTLYVCYFSYLFLGARGPHETLSFLHVLREPAGFFDNFVKAIQAKASISGAAFPSSHVAAVWIVLIHSFKFKKWLGWGLTPLILTLSISVVYLQYHYAVDSIAGIIVAFATYPIARWLEKKFSKPNDGTHLDTSFVNV